MEDWSQGYNTNTAYTFGFYREIAPSYLRTICRLQGFVEPNGRCTYLELGCGQGLGPNLLAASNPEDTFIGVDFSPEHIVGARRLAEQAELHNVTFLERSFEECAANLDSLPECDIIALHGIYSWIGPVQREAIRTIIRQKLKAGGILYLSYNCAAGWGPIANFQKLFRDLAQSHGGTFAETAATLSRMKAFRDSDFGFFKNNPVMEKLLDNVSRQNINYVEHEYMNAHWQPFHFQDIAREMRSCKLSFIGSANPIDNSETLSFPPKLANLVRQEPDTDLQESLKDLHCSRRFRKDVYVKGAVRLPGEQWSSLLRETVFALVKPRADIEMTITVPRGQLKLGKPAYSQVLDLLESGPNTLGAILPQASELRDVVIVLMQIAAIHPVSTSKDNHAAHRLNSVLTGSVSNLSRYNNLVAPSLGSAIGINRILAPTLAAFLSGNLKDVHDDIEIARLRSDPRFAHFYKDSPAEATTSDKIKQAVSLGVLP